MRTTRIHVDQHAIKENRKRQRLRSDQASHIEDLPVLTVKDYTQNRKCRDAVIHHVETGEEIARVVYSPDRPLPCGAHVWIETRHPVETT